MKRSLTLALLTSAVLLGGCASTASDSGEMDALRAMAQQAMDRAEAAETMAKQASSQASRASSDAAAAMQAAQQSQSCCEANTQRINRAFEKSMQK